MLSNFRSHPVPLYYKLTRIGMDKQKEMDACIPHHKTCLIYTHTSIHVFLLTCVKKKIKKKNKIWKQRPCSLSGKRRKKETYNNYNLHLTIMKTITQQSVKQLVTSSSHMECLSNRAWKWQTRPPFCLLPPHKIFIFSS